MPEQPNARQILKQMKKKMTRLTDIHWLKAFGPSVIKIVPFKLLLIVSCYW